MLVLELKPSQREQRCQPRKGKCRWREMVEAAAVAVETLAVAAVAVAVAGAVPAACKSRREGYEDPSRTTCRRAKHDDQKKE